MSGDVPTRRPEVEHLPPECRSDLALRFYFVRLFGPEAIVQAGAFRTSGSAVERTSGSGRGA